MLLVVIKIRIYYIFIYIHTNQIPHAAALFCCLSFSYLLMLVVGNVTLQQSLIFQLRLHLFNSILVLTIIHLHLHHFQCLSMLQFYIFGFAYIER